MRFEALEYFVAIVEAKSYTQAAKRLFVSQQGLSKSVKSLERELNVQLFERTATGVEPTRAGKVLMPLAQRCLDARSDLKREMVTFCADAVGNAAPSGQLTLHAMPFVSDSLFSLLDEDLARLALDEPVIIEEDYPDILAGLNDKRSSKVAALCLPAKELEALRRDRDIAFEPLFEAELVVAGSPDLLPGDTRSVTPGEIAHLPVAYYNDSVLNSLVERLFASCPLTNVVTHARNQTRIYNYVHTGRTLSFTDSLSVFLSPDRDRIAYRGIEGAEPFTIGFAWARDGAIDEHQLRYIEQFKACVRARCNAYLEKREHAGEDAAATASPSTASKAPIP